MIHPEQKALLNFLIDLKKTSIELLNQDLYRYTNDTSFLVESINKLEGRIIQCESDLHLLETLLRND